MPKKRVKNADISEADLLLEIGADNRLRSIGLDPDGDPVELMIALNERVAKHEAERAAYFEQEVAKEEAALEYVEKVMKLRPYKKTE
jgi:hypothetical protein